MNNAIRKYAISVSLAVSLAGCAVGPDYKRPTAPQVDQYTSKPLPEAVASGEGSQGQPQKFVQGKDIPGQWWELFHSPSLNRLVERALKANPDLAAAQATLRQAQETELAARGTLFPIVNAGGSITREQTTGAQFGSPGTPGALFTLYNASVNVSYTLDIFGGARRMLEGVAAQEEYERFQLEAAYLTISSNVVTSALQEASLRAQIAATQAIIDVESKQLDMLQQRFRVGGVAQSNVLAQQTALAQVRASLPPLEKQLAVVRNQLATLSGSVPSEDSAETFDLDSLQLPAELPISLPSQLVEQRPDVRASESLLHEASAQVGVATANMFPQFNLSAAIGSDAATASALFSAGSKMWNVGGGLTQPIFHGGTLLHERRAAIAAYDGAAAQYRSTVLSAFQDVANVLDSLQSDATTLQAQKLASQSASDSLDMARRQFQVGAVDYQTLLNAEQAYQQTQIGLAQARASRYADTAALFQSLGGGWWNRKDGIADQNAGTDK